MTTSADYRHPISVQGSFSVRPLTQCISTTNSHGTIHQPPLPSSLRTHDAFAFDSLRA